MLIADYLWQNPSAIAFDSTDMMYVIDSNLLTQVTDTGGESVAVTIIAGNSSKLYQSS